ncbi:MAG: hypothetical protein ACYTF1_20010, partial [Planctomycetota bacterium]
YYAVEEALKCAKNGYYAVGIITFAQLLNLLKEKTPSDRHLVAHEILSKRPSKDNYEEIVQQFKNAASEFNYKESINYKDINQYKNLVLQKWQELMTKQFNLSFDNC